MKIMKIIIIIMIIIIMKIIIIKLIYFRDYSLIWNQKRVPIKINSKKHIRYNF